MMQHQFARAVGSSVRTVSRWEGGTSSPAPWHFHALAALLHPVDAALAHEAAQFGGTTLEELGLGKPPPPPATPLPTPLPVRLLIDAVLFAAIDALGAPSPPFDKVRAALRAAFAHARDLRLDPAEVIEALSPPPPEPPAAQPGIPPTGGGAPQSLRRSPNKRSMKRNMLMKSR
jgi:hypothetical protein